MTEGRDAPTEPVPAISSGAGSGDVGSADLGEAVSRRVRLFGSTAFFRLWTAQVVASLGDWVGFVAIVAVAERIGGSAPEAAISLVMSARIVPGFFLAQVAGVVVDRLDRKQVMVACNLFRAVVLLSVPFVDEVWQLVAVSFLLEVGALLWSPAKEASVPNLVPPQHLPTANSLSLIAAYGTFPIAALVFAGLSKVSEHLATVDAFDGLDLTRESLAIVGYAIAFVVSALIILHVPLPPGPAREPVAGAPRLDLGRAFRDVAEGWRFIAADPVVRAVMVALGTGLIGGGMLVPLGPVFSQEVLGGGAAGFGLLLTALGLGMAIGVIAQSALQRRVNRPRMFVLCVMVAGVSLFAAASMSTLLPAFLGIVVLGVCTGSVYVLGFTILHEGVDDALRGRTFSTLYTLVRLCVLVAFAVGPALSSLAGRLSARFFGDDRTVTIAGASFGLPGVRLTLWGAAVIIGVAGVLARISLRSAARDGERATRLHRVGPR